MKSWNVDASEGNRSHLNKIYWTLYLDTKYFLFLKMTANNQLTPKFWFHKRTFQSLISVDIQVKKFVLLFRTCYNIDWIQIFFIEEKWMSHYSQTYVCFKIYQPKLLSPNAGKKKLWVKKLCVCIRPHFKIIKKILFWVCIHSVGKLILVANRNFTRELLVLFKLLAFSGVAMFWNVVYRT